MPDSRSTRPGLLFALLTCAALVLLAVARTGLVSGLPQVMATLFQWVMLLGGVALIMGVVNVAVLHLRRIQAGQRDWGLSLVLLAVMMAVLVGGVLSPQGLNSPLATWIFDSLLAPGQAALFALLIFFLAAAAYRYLRVDRPGGGWMLLGALLILLIQLPLLGNWLPEPLVNGVFWLVDTPLAAVLRGVLIGGGVALLTMALRMLLGKV